MTAGTKQRIATHIEVEWLDRLSAVVTCPNCGAEAPMRQLLDIDYRPPDAEHRFMLQICPVCTVRFVDNPEMMDYGTAELIEIGWNTYQVQLGAGVWPISAPLTRVEKPAGSRVLEIGGAYGFGLDFCIRARGWRGEGYDPSPLAAFGARELGLTIHQEYFGDAQVADGPWDVVISTEVIEHLPHPPEFLRLMRRALADDGVLVMTTPDAAWITPELSAGAMMPLLSPGAHAVLQTAKSLEVALKAAGFNDVTVLRESTSLIAYASAAPFELSTDAQAARAMYRRYLVERAGLTEATSDLRLGFAGRGLFEAANDGDAPAVEAAWAALLPAVQARFGLDLENLAVLPVGADEASLAELAQLMPLGLGMILFGRAMHLVSQGHDRVALLPALRVAKAAIAALQDALAKRSLTDLLSASIGRIVETEILLCLAEAGDSACLQPLIATGDELTGWRGFVALVNADALELAAALQSALLPPEPSGGMPPDLRRNALLSLANFALAPGGATERAFEVARGLRELGEDVDGILLQAFTRLVNASRYDEALAAITAHDLDALAARAAGKTGQDAKLARMMLDLAVGDPAEIPARLKGMEIEPPRRDILLQEAFIRLVNASRYDEALGFIRDHEIQALAARTGGETARNVGLARMVLDLAVGDPAEIPGRLVGLEIEPARRDVLLMEAFIRLVNGSRYGEALEFAADYEIPALAERRGGEAGRNVGLARMVLDLAVGDPADIPGRLEGMDLPAERRAVLLLEAFVRLVNSSRFAEALRFSQTYGVAALAQQQSGESGANAAIALAVLELAQGDPARVPAHLSGTGIAPERRDALLLGAFTGLVNAARHDEARALKAAEPAVAALAQAPGKAGDDARMANVMLDLHDGQTEAALRQLTALASKNADPAVLGPLWVDGFVRLVNEGRFEQAAALAKGRFIENRLAGCKTGLRHDAIAALLMLDLQISADAARIVQRVDALLEAGLEEQRLLGLALAAFVTLVNRGEFSTARLLLNLVEPVLVKLRPPFSDAECNGLFAAGILFLQDRDDYRKAATTLARLRDALVKRGPAGAEPDPLFWPALRGEVLALHRLNRGADATLLLQSFIATYGGAPEDLMKQIERS